LLAPKARRKSAARLYGATRTGFAASASRSSANPLFGRNLGLGVARRGDGGMDALYKNVVNPIPPAFRPGGGVFCGALVGL